MGLSLSQISYLRELAVADEGKEHSPLIGFAFDGFPIYGPFESAGVMAKDLTGENALNDFNLHWDASAAGITTRRREIPIHHRRILGTEDAKDKMAGRPDADGKWSGGNGFGGPPVILDGHLMEASASAVLIDGLSRFLARPAQGQQPIPARTLSEAGSGLRFLNTCVALMDRWMHFDQGRRDKEVFRVVNAVQQIVGTVDKDRACGGIRPQVSPLLLNTKLSLNTIGPFKAP